MAEEAKKGRLSALSEKIKEHAENSSARAQEASGGRQNGGRLAPGASAQAANSTAAVKPTAAAGSTVRPTAAAGSTVRPTAAAGSTVKPTAAAKPAGAANRFTDVPADAYYADAMDWAVKQGITSGTSDTTFAPGNPCHKGHAATFLWRFLGSPKPKNSNNPFKDVSDGPFYQAILWAAWSGVISGETSTTFVHTTPCTRRQVLTYIMRTQGTPKATEEEAAKWAAHRGLMTGITGGIDAPCTRADMVTFLYRIRQK
ncbi:MAG: S-layer homology domain-containing protein [Oscillibacter sp.]|nr:S-layer homology domain-containing protein [Oscillibacter sp.]